MTAQLIDSHREQQILKTALRRLMPFVIVMILMSYIDRANLSVLAKPIDASLGMTATAFGFATGLFFWGYAFFEVPSNIALVKYGSRAWLGRIMVSWGLITALMSFAQNELHFGILRFLLGVAEAGLSPGLLVFLTMWFPRSQQVRPLSFFQISFPIGIMLGALITSGLLGLFESLTGSQGWRWVFLVEGVITVLVGVFVFLTLPNTPRDARWLSAQDADYLSERIASEQRAAGVDPYGKLTELQRAGKVLRSGRAWYLALIYLAQLTGFWAITFFLPQIISTSFKTNAVMSGVLSAVPWAFALVAILLVGWLARSSDRPNHWISALQAAGAAGLLVAAIANNPVVMIAGLTVGICGAQAATPLFYKLQTHLFTSGVMTAVLLALVNSIGNFGGFIGPFVYGFSMDKLGGATLALVLMATFLLLAAVGSFFAPRVLQDR
ncbi:Sugar phosphate permease [Bradyrhizobium erythrophlei]|nr:Sugar phosphate permease [Bradyrhizobium erythrophlei]